MFDSIHTNILWISTAYKIHEYVKELFQMLKDDAVNVLHSVCQQIWKTQ